MEQAVSDMEATFGLSNTVLEENLGVFKNKVLPTGTLSQTPDLKNFCQNLSAVGKIQPVIIAILSYQALTFVYNIMGVTQRVMRVHLRQL